MFVGLLSFSNSMKKRNLIQPKAKIGMAAGYALTRIVTDDDKVAEFGGQLGGTMLGGGLAYTGAQWGLTVGTVGGPLGAVIGAGAGWL